MYFYNFKRKKKIQEDDKVAEKLLISIQLQIFLTHSLELQIMNLKNFQIK